MNSSVETELLGIVLAIEQASRFAATCKIAKSKTKLVVENDCLTAIALINNVYCDEKKTTNPLICRVWKSLNHWPLHEMKHIGRSSLKSVHLEAQRARKDFLSVVDV